ncbi:hypothetical protein E3226_007480 [Legionella geestiana]|uniref:hypothetical protein n=1 Tax=Legionella geestiana TaxID=45065 RepID=UPI001091D19C|nr:hypothetical protein [Legionella geestiana]QDQ40247.1 hypothetical protein E3226_007480 [Legionella geestiana]
MEFWVNDKELAALCGLPHIQQLAYFRGIRPYMDVKTGTVGVKRGISLQSIAEQLYIEPHPGIQSGSFSRDQIRRALAGLERAGVIAVQSQGRQLILQCVLATLGYSVQNKAATNPPQQAAIDIRKQISDFKELLSISSDKPATPETLKAAIPLKEDNYIFLLSCFEQFWQAYPEKKSRPQALEAFRQLQPDAQLFAVIMQSLDAQIRHREVTRACGQWLPPWKYPANWLEKRCWEDELTMETQQETQHATRRKVTRHDETQDWYRIPDDNEADQPVNNVYAFEQYKTC